MVKTGFLAHKSQIARLAVMIAANVYIFWPRIAEYFGLMPMKVLNGLDFFDFVGNGVINLDLLFMLSWFLLVPLFFGRALCGWFCHIAPLQDLGEWLLKKSGIHKLRWKKSRLVFSKKLTIILPLLVLMGIVIPEVYKGLNISGWMKTGEIKVEWMNHTNPDHEDFPEGWALFGIWFVMGVVLVGMFGKRPICRYVCYLPPLGLAKVQSWAKFKVRKVSECIKGCNHCSDICPVGVDVRKEINAVGYVKSNDCMSCLKCTSYCPASNIVFSKATGNEVVSDTKIPHFKAEGLPLSWEILIIVVALYVTVKTANPYGERGMMIDWMPMVLSGVFTIYFLYRIISNLRKPNEN